MQPFTLQISTSPPITISGLVSVPTSTSTSPSIIPSNLPSPASNRPLLVLLHGGSYDARYYDFSPQSSIEPLGTALGIPVISLDRQGYKDSTPVSLPSDSSTSLSFLQEQAKNLHTLILPALWTKYGKPSGSGATSLVLAGHSIGAMVAVLTASLYSTSPTPTSPSTPHSSSTSTSTTASAYPLTGLITTGIAHIWNPSLSSPSSPSTSPPTQPDATGQFVIWSDPARDKLMLGISSDQSDSSPSFLSLHATLNNPVPISEVQESMLPPSQAAWVEAAKGVKVPVLGLVGEHDFLFETGRDGMASFAGLFSGAQSVEVGVVGNAPHCLELSWQATGVWLKVLGHAVACAVGVGIGVGVGEKEVGKGWSRGNGNRREEGKRRGKAVAEEESEKVVGDV